MGRSAKYEFIGDERVRRQTLRKRKAGLFKKVSELKTLCCVDACAVMYGNTGVQPDVWPSPFEAYNLFQRFNNLPIIKRETNMMNQEKFIRQNILKVSKKLEKEKKKNRWVEVEQLVAKNLVEHNLHDVSNLEDLKDVAYLLDENIKLVNEVQNIKRAGNENGTGSKRGKKK
ncbi:hypothetical protein Acr_10g0006670 [Actinidia rufa]|uniref:MADS-box domain-containing protein n=1 Tax=Actinidia rufa TaxID=165716 RepID=A0A7J0F998_9ERIC|nr:hypothetical protein Acr_10g0006670 [Actinidia rufa]